jgi:hypothetical protein
MALWTSSLDCRVEAHAESAQLHSVFLCRMRPTTMVAWGILRTEVNEQGLGPTCKMGPITIEAIAKHAVI